MSGFFFVWRFIDWLSTDEQCNKKPRNRL